MYYRLKLVSRDGYFQYSKTIVISKDFKSDGKLRIFPNPVVGYLAVSFPAAAAKASISIFRVDGKKTGEHTVAAGSVQYSIGTRELRHGQYIVVYKNNGSTLTASFIK